MVHRYNLRRGGTPRTFRQAGSAPPRKTPGQIHKDLLDNIAGIQACMMAAEKDGALYCKLQELEQKALDRYNEFMEGEGERDGRGQGRAQGLLITGPN